VWLLVGIAICNDKSMADIVNQLYIVEQTDKPFIASNASTQHGKVSNILFISYNTVMR
jgi:hypothetical protein